MVKPQEQIKVLPNKTRWYANIYVIAKDKLITQKQMDGVIPPSTF